MASIQIIYGSNHPRHIIHIIQIEARGASNLDYVDYKDSDFKFSKCGSYVDNMDLLL